MDLSVNGDDEIVTESAEELDAIPSREHFNQSNIHVGDVLREAEGIVHKLGPAQLKIAEGSKLLVDEANVEYIPPCHSDYPIEIIVRHNTVISQKRHPEDIVHDSETPLLQHDQDRLCGMHRKKFVKGHRRAYSMPIGNSFSSAITMIGNKTTENGSHKRHMVRYRMHPRNILFMKNFDAAMENDLTMDPNFLMPLDVDNDLEIEINEEEIIHPMNSDLSSDGKYTVVKKFWEARWKVTQFEFLPEWLQDNEYLHSGHRPPLLSFGSCFKSIFLLHSETGNIWTHMYGCVAFIGLAAWFLTRPNDLVQWKDKLVFSAFFLGAITCMGLSFAFHTVLCHSPAVGKLFNKLDYAGINLLILGSFIPWIYYSYHCRPLTMLVYIGMISLLTACALFVSLAERFAKPKFRPIRAAVFVAMGLSSVFPVFHNLISDGPYVLLNELSFHWLALMGFLYIAGATFYATRTPERFFPGKCDIWCQSHQMLHLCVIAAAFVHFRGLTELASSRLQLGSCAEQLLERYGYESDHPTFFDDWFQL